MPNIIHALGAGVSYANQAWSIGSEEQFYIIWPIIIKKIKNKLFAILSVIVIFIIIKLIVKHYDYFPQIKSIGKVLNLLCIDSMAIGGVFAYLRFKYVNIQSSFLCSIWFQIAIYFLSFYLIYSNFNFGVLTFEIYSVLFSLIILNLSFNETSIINFKNKTVNYLGKISYGLYMYHPIAIGISIKTLLYFNIYNSFYLYISCILLTILFAYISYNYFEKAFIERKIKYSKIISGENAIN
jgi:peptidoglycan/LPS O-acetylase OafA/YrhL